MINKFIWLVSAIKKHTSFGQIIALIASVATLITAISALMSISEMKEQRRSSYRPELIFIQTNGSMKLLGQKSYHDLVPDNIEKEMSSDGMGIRKNPIKVDRLGIYNIGEGPARDVSVKWVYPIDAIVKFVNDKNKFKNFDVTLKSRATDTSAIVTVDKDGSELQFGVLTRQDFQFVLPYSKTSKKYEIDFPKAYFILLYYYFSVLKKEEYFSHTQFPAVRAEVTYKDMGDETHKEIFESRMHILFIRHKPPEAHLEVEISFIKVEK
ncbi:MAG: hypothetical protein KME56_05095 [Candidatus Thiodiazotropha sp. (ex Ctena orbiculata)]|nr:hypothetical protein [Candidatus Thiodiazotropha taylori]MBT2995988.1 hypothetical protein [Candidatus Thiodiazotropha taylori]MBT3001644.1 hypothetical protein [Candidatus Thiodiazotropha taylori]MBV2105523.1 hypothetical protein [Candidatus Thiodiazotropha taylori]MBV2111455.1 hypothetical protein [Candidatus Thiodiazotropha taylori]